MILEGAKVAHWLNRVTQYRAGLAVIFCIAWLDCLQKTGKVERVAPGAQAQAQNTTSSTGKLEPGLMPHRADRSGHPLEWRRLEVEGDFYTILTLGLAIPTKAAPP
jgi:hypothetical protein